jgi:small-conductance mechanosensitive channel
MIAISQSTDIAAKDIYVALAYYLGFFLLALLAYFLLKKVVKGLVDKTGTDLDNMALEALELPILIGIVLVGLYLGTLSMPLGGSAEDWVNRGFGTAFVALGAYSGVNLLDAVLRWYAKEVAVKTKTALDDKIVSVLRVTIPVIAGVLVLYTTLDIVGVDVHSMRDWLAQHGARLALILGLSILAFLALGRVVPAALKPAVARQRAGQTEAEIQKRADTLAAVIVTSGQVFIIIVASFMILSELGVNIAPVLAGVGVVGIAIGFGSQSLVKDIIAGIFIVAENQYRVGDVVRIADISGLVEEINLRRTVLRDLDGIVHVVPNGEIRVASNFTKEWSRVNLNISVAYGEDLDRVMAVINRVGQELAEDPQWAPLILKAPQALRVDNLGDSGIEIKILGDTQPIKQWDVMGELRKRLKKAFDEEGIEIPWPHTKVYFGGTSHPWEARQDSQDTAPSKSPKRE